MKTIGKHWWLTFVLLAPAVSLALTPAQIAEQQQELAKQAAESQRVQRAPEQPHVQQPAEPRPSYTPPQNQTPAQRPSYTPPQNQTPASRPSYTPPSSGAAGQPRPSYQPPASPAYTPRTFTPGATGRVPANTSGPNQATPSVKTYTPGAGAASGSASSINHTASGVTTYTPHAYSPNANRATPAAGNPSTTAHVATSPGAATATTHENQKQGSVSGCDHEIHPG
jgi:hypothetical protein